MRTRHTSLSPRWILAAAVVATAVVAQPLTAQQPVQNSAVKNPAQKYPDILSAKVTPRGADIFDFDVTVSSLYDTAQRYADAFRVLSPDGRPLGERVLLHDHADEQPFTRDLHGVRVPAGIRIVVIQGRDKTHGYGGKTLDVELPGR
jgi:hypothetical protein